MSHRGRVENTAESAAGHSGTGGNGGEIGENRKKGEEQEKKGESNGEGRDWGRGWGEETTRAVKEREPEPRSEAGAWAQGSR